MSYPEPPGERIAYDLDGSVVTAKYTSYSTVTSYELDTLAKQYLNVDDSSGVFGNHAFTSTADVVVVAVLFPLEKRLRGFFFDGHAGQGAGSGFRYGWLYFVETSADTTNGVDGTWIRLGSYGDRVSIRSGSGRGYFLGSTPPDVAATVVASASDVSKVYAASPSQRGLQVVTGAGTRQVRGVRVLASPPYGLSAGANQIKLHLYGENDTSASTDRLEYWSPTEDLQAPVNYFDWRDVEQGSSAQRSFRVKNLSTTKSAQGIEVDVLPRAVATLEPAPQTHDMMLLSFDTVTWTPTLTIGLLAPGAVSPTIHVRRIVPSNAPPGLWAPRLVSTPASWT